MKQSQFERSTRQAQGPLRDLGLHTLGWKAFQDLCSQICQHALGRVVAVYREAQDGGQDAVFLISDNDNTDVSEDGTVQCKFSSDPKRRFKVADLYQEANMIRSLVASGQARCYVFMTSMGVDAPVAEDARRYLRELGVAEPLVVGREWITLQIQSSAKLRALVPRVYGLGDLSIILDERTEEQTQALIGYLLPQLRLYVPTSAHRYAVRTLAEYGVVLLLGPPASGKSMLAAILATSALDVESRRALQLHGPRDLIAHWNPNASDGFYWIDDAFGANQLRVDYVEDWIGLMTKMRAAATNGNKFVITSRTHIWLAAKRRLGIRNQPRFIDDTAVVRMDVLSREERAQMLYNHIKFGTQDQAWKEQVRPYLENLAAEAELLPEIARRLGQRAYTNRIRRLPIDLYRFVAAPMEFLKETINELSGPQQAALTLVFLHRSIMPVKMYDAQLAEMVTRALAVQHGELSDSFDYLIGSFLIKSSMDNTEVWRYAHPTIADAISSILSERADRLELYLRGTRAEILMTQVSCIGASSIRDSVIVPDGSQELLLCRLLEVPNEPYFNSMLFSFLVERASSWIREEVLRRDPTLLTRVPRKSARLIDDERLRLCARLHAEGVLSPDTREQLADQLVTAVCDSFDGSFLDDDEILALIPATRLLAISARLSTDLLSRMARQLESRDQHWSADERDAEDYFDDLRSFLAILQRIFREQDDVLERIREMKGMIRKILGSLTSREDSVPATNALPIPDVIRPSGGTRSIFSDLGDPIELDGSGNIIAQGLT